MRRTGTQPISHPVLMRSSFSVKPFSLHLNMSGHWEGIRLAKGRRPSRRAKSRIDRESTFYKRVVPALLVLMAVATILLILVAIGVILRVVPFQ